MRHQKQTPSSLQLFVMKCRHMTKGRVKLCLLCDLLMTVCDVIGICLIGGGGLPWTAANGKACFLSRDTVSPIMKCASLGG